MSITSVIPSHRVTSVNPRRRILGTEDQLRILRTLQRLEDVKVTPKMISMHMIATIDSIRETLHHMMNVSGLVEPAEIVNRRIYSWKITALGRQALSDS